MGVKVHTENPSSPQPDPGNSLEETEASQGKVLASGSLKGKFQIPFSPETKNDKRILEGSENAFQRRFEML